MEERTGEAFAFQEFLTVVGKKLQVGNLAPNFSLDYVDLIVMTIHRAQLAESACTVRVLSIINSLDMPTCRLQTLRWEALHNSLPPDVSLYTISMDLPHAQVHWQTTEGILHQMLSAHRSEQFALSYGLLLKEWRLLQRAVFVIDHNDHIIYVEYVADQQREPDYEEACKAVLSIMTA